MKKCIIAIIALGSAIASTAQIKNIPRPDFVISIGEEPETLDPSMIESYSEREIYMALFEGLVVYDPKTGRAAPGVAESWTTSADGLRITFRLRHTEWSDGTAITAHTVVDSWLRTLAPETRANSEYMVSAIISGASDYNRGRSDPEAVGIRALDDYTFQVDLVAPAAYAVDMMAHYAFAILPMHSIRRYGDDWANKEILVTNGPYTLSNWERGEFIDVAKSQRYWDAAATSLSIIRYACGADDATTYERISAGEYDWVDGIPLDLIDELKGRLDVVVSPLESTCFYTFNTARAPFDDARVRKALTISLNLDELVDTITKGGEIPTGSLVPPMDGYKPPVERRYDLPEARRLLAEAGYPNGVGFPAITFINNPNDIDCTIAQWAIETWQRELGISITLLNMEWRKFIYMRCTTHDFGIASSGWVGIYLDPMTFLEMFVQGTRNNDGQYKNEDYNALIKKAAAMPLSPERMAVLRKAEELLIGVDQAIAPLYYDVIHDMIDRSVWDGWYPNPLSVHPVKNIKRKPGK